MVKKHQSPEFVVIQQDQANAKFFVASELTFTGKTSGGGDNPPSTSVSQYGEGEGLDF